MSSGCCAGTMAEPSTSRCPESGSAGTAVDWQTVKALLTETALRRLTNSEYRFCPDAACDVVYFAADEIRFTTTDLRVPVWHKLPFGSRPVCYCFGESELSIRSEIESGGRSAAVERVREHIAAGRCACEVRNPRGACCLGDLIAAVKRVASAITAGSPAGSALSEPVRPGERDARHDRNVIPEDPGFAADPIRKADTTSVSAEGRINP